MKKILLGFVVSLAWIAPASAMCVYNETDYQVSGSFDCGFMCGSSWKFVSKPPQGSCYPGKGGHVDVEAHVQVYRDKRKCSAQVSPHGNIKVKWDNSAGRVVCEVH